MHFCSVAVFVLAEEYHADLLGYFHGRLSVILQPTICAVCEHVLENLAYLRECKSYEVFLLRSAMN